MSLFFTGPSYHAYCLSQSPSIALAPSSVLHFLLHQSLLLLLNIVCAASYLLFHARCVSFFFYWKDYIASNAAGVSPSKQCLGPAYVAFSRLSSFNTALTIPLSVLLLVALSMFDFIGYFHTCCSSFLVMHMFSLFLIWCVFVGYLTRSPCLCAPILSSYCFGVIVSF